MRKIEKISDIQEIMKYTMSTPGLVVNGKLKHSGKPLPNIEKVKALIKEEAVVMQELCKCLQGTF